MKGRKLKVKLTNMFPCKNWKTVKSFRERDMSKIKVFYF